MLIQFLRMATLDDKILGEKLHYYCSSSEDEADDDKDSEAGATEPQPPPPKFIPEPELQQWEGYSCNVSIQVNHFPFK